MKKLDISEIVQHDFSSREYLRENVTKNQIVLHHTVSSEGVVGDIGWWVKDPKRIATFCLIDHKGIIHQVFSSAFWAYHLGVNKAVFRSLGLTYKNLDSQSIGIEIDSLGGLKWSDSKNSWVSVYGHAIPYEQVQVYPEGYKGYKAYQKYTPEQIESARQLLVYLCEKYKISKKYNPQMWDVSKEALSGKNGIWSHTSYRSDKSDVHPQPELVEMLKGLE
jgi:N-acetyl-anhydromuramyl-L-alanine amidase AmpD